MSAAAALRGGGGELSGTMLAAPGGPGTCARSQWATVVPAQAVWGAAGPRRASSGPNLLHKPRA